MSVSVSGWVVHFSSCSTYPPRWRSTVFGRAALAVALLGILSTAPARAWNFDEHFEVATRAYTRACATLCDSPKASPPLPVEAQRKITLACGPCRLYEEDRGLGTFPGCRQVLRPDPASGSDSLAEAVSASCHSFVSSAFHREAIVFGQSCAIAGDHLSHPKELVGDLSGRQAASPARFLQQVLRNRKHFAPHSMEEYQKLHAAAIQQALGELPRGSASAASSLLDQALAKESFACHYLQDSFAAGHLGFNRGASSNTPSRLFHNHWNRLGRCVRNAPYDAPWAAFGDGMLCSADNAENLCRLSEATYLSILNTLTAFVEGKRSDSEGWGIRTLLPLQYANAGPKMLDPLDIVTLPFRVRPLNLRRSGSETRPNRAYEISHYHPYVDPEARKLSSSDLCRELTQASEQGEDFHETDTRHFYYLGIGESTRPAVTGFSLSLYTLGAGLRDDSDGAAALVGASFAFSLRKDLWGGLHPLSANYRLGIGQGDWGGSRSTLFDLSVGFPLAFTHEGLLTHEIVVGVIGAARKGSFEPSPHLSYRLGAEVERFILFVQVGRAWQGEGDLAVSAGLSLGFGARGGGPIRLIDRRQKRR